MSGENDNGNGQGEGGKEFEPITSQEQLNRLIGGRIDSVKSQFADYDDLKAKAAKFDEVEAKNLSELEKANRRASEAEAKAAKYEQAEQRRTWVSEVAKSKGVPADLLRGSTKQDLEAHADQLKAAGIGTAPQRRATPPGKPAGDGDKTGSRAAAALREMRRS